MPISKYVVYTCITGGYDSLREVRYLSPSIDYVCFTDNAALTSKTWKIRSIPDDLKNISQVKKQRLIKILPHKYLPEYSVSLWIDSNIEVVSDLKEFFKKYDLSKNFLYTNKHPTRDCIYREQLAVIRLGKDTFANTNPQMNRYHDEGFPEHYGLAETNIMLRKHSDPLCMKTMNLWGEEILKCSHRDQLSFNYAIWKAGAKDRVEYLDEKYYNLHVSDNAFFKLKRHVKVAGFKPFSPTTIEVVLKEPDPALEKKQTLDVAPPAATHPSPHPPIPVQAEKEEAKEPAPPVSVVVFTHNRTNVAKEVVKSLLKNLKYPGLKWVLSDDRSAEGHLEELLSVFRASGVEPIVCRTSSDRFGLGASMNNGLKEAFKHSEVVLRVEDDWILERELDLGKHVSVLIKNRSVGGIRLGMVGGGVDTDPRLYAGRDYKALVGSSLSSWLLCNQVALIHKRLHEKLGWYKENVSADGSEEDFRTRFNNATVNGTRHLLLLVPSSMKWRTFDDPSLWFIHVGRSTLGHKIYREPKRYSWIYEEKAAKAIPNKAVIASAAKKVQKSEPKIEAKKAFFKVVIPSYNVEKYVARCVDSIEAQTFKDFEIVIVDDMSTDSTRNELDKIKKRYSNVNVVFLDKKRYGGGARNAGIDFPGLSSSYTIFLDADDYLISGLAFKSIYSAIKKNGDPDCIVLSYERDYGAIKNRKVIAFETKPWEVIRSRKFAPWLKVVKTSKMQRFVESRVCANDVVWTFRQMDAIKTIVPLPTPLIHYTTNNANSVWNGKERSLQQTKDAILLLKEDLSKEKYKSREIESYRNNEISLVANHKPPYAFLSAFSIKLCTIIIPCYNVEKYVGDCLDSVLLQETKYDYEVICVNDGSSDKTRSILESYQKKTNKITIIDQKNSGLSASRNAGLKKASGKYIVFLDSDDKLDKRSVETIVGTMEKNRLDLLYFGGSIFYDGKVDRSFYPPYFYHRDASGKVMRGEDLYRRFRNAGKLVLSACLQAVNREFLEKSGVLFKTGMIYEDNLYSIQTLFLAERTMSISDQLYMRRVRENSLMTSNKSYEYIRSNLLIARDIFAFVKKAKISEMTKDDAFCSLVKVLIRNFKTNNPNLIRSLPNFEKLDKHGDFKTIFKYSKIYSLEDFSKRDFENILSV